MSEPVNRRALFGAACGGMFVFGIVGALLGTLFGLPDVRARLDLTLGRQGDLFSILYAGLLAMTLAAGPTIDRYGNRVVLLLSSALVAAAFGGFAAGTGYRAAVLAALAVGIGGGGLNIAANTVVSELYPEDRGRMLNYLAAFFGAGALSVPLLASSFGPGVSVGTLLWLAAALAVACAVAYVSLEFPPAREATDFSPRDIPAAVRRPGVLLLSALLFFETGNEASVSGWVSTYVGDIGWSTRTATAVLAAYWVAVMIGRALAGRLHGRVSSGRILVLCGLGSMAGCAWLMAAHSLWTLVAASLLTSLSLAGVYPTTLALAGDRYQRFAGTVFGTLFSVGALGGMALPSALGHLSETAGLRTGMIIPLLGTAAVTLLAVVIWRDQGSGIGDQGSGIGDRGSGMKNEG
jgi:FHS family glucose/mannose:H+ symporter-like MFS transporter